MRGFCNSLNNSLIAEDSLKFHFATDGEGNYGYLGADDSFIPFKSGIDVDSASVIATAQNTSNNLVTLSKSFNTITEYTVVVVVRGGEGMGASNDTLSCTDTSSVIKKVISDPLIGNTENNSALHCFSWIVKAEIGTTISVSAPKPDYNSTLKMYVIAL